MSQNYLAYLVKALTMAVAVFITSSIVILIDLPLGFLAVVTVIVLMQLYFTELRAKAFERIFGTVVATTLILGLLIVLHHYFAFMLLGSALLLMVFVHYFVMGFMPYAMIMAAVTVSLISGMIMHKNIHEAINIGFYWILNVYIGALIVLIMDFISTKWISKEIKLANNSFSLKKHLNSFYEKSVLDFNATIIACRVALTFLSIVLINRRMNWSFIDIQALIAGIIVSVQLTLKMTHQRAFLRLVGVIFGAVLAIFYAYLLQLYSEQMLLIGLITISIAFFTFLSERFKSGEYALLQASIMLPLILMTSSATTINVRLAFERSLGSVEGALLGIIMVYLSWFFLKK